MDGILQPDMNETEIVLKIKIFHHKTILPQEAIDVFKSKLPDNISSIIQLSPPVTEVIS